MRHCHSNGRAQDVCMADQPFVVLFHNGISGKGRGEHSELYSKEHMDTPVMVTIILTVCSLCLVSQLSKTIHGF